MISIRVTRDDHLWATQKKLEFKRPGEHNPQLETQNTIFVGYLGERMFHKLYPNAIHFDSTHADFILRSRKIDVKTSIRNGPFENYRFVNVKESTKRRFPDFYVFALSEPDFTIVHFIGYISRKEFWEKSKLLVAGLPHPFAPNKTLKVDTRFLSVEQLKTEWKEAKQQ